MGEVCHKENMTLVSMHTEIGYKWCMYTLFKDSFCS